MSASARRWCCESFPPKLFQQWNSARSPGRKSAITSNEMKASAVLLLAALLFTVSGCQSGQESHPQSAQAASPAWRGVHLSVDSDENADALGEELPRLAAIG